MRLRKYLPSASRLEVRDGDRVILELEPGVRVSAEQLDGMQKALQREFPNNEVMVVVGGRLRVQPRIEQATQAPGELR